MTTAVARRADSDRAAGIRLPLALSETALLLVHLSVVAGFVRLFEDGAFVGPLLGFTVGAHVLAVVSRRRRVALPVVLLLATAGAAVASAWILFPSTVRLGLPTAETWRQAGDALHLSRDRFEEVAAPAPALPGFLLASGLALWVAVWFADWAAFRLRATAEAVAPAAVLFVFGAMLGSGDHRLVSALGFAAAVLLFAASHRALRSQLDQAWLTTSPIAGPRAVLQAGVALAVVALVAGAVVGPRLPGSEADAVVRWRSDVRGGGDRTTISPIIDLRPRLVNQSDTRLFTVEADRPAYWRLTSLDTFDGDIWRSGGTYSPVEGALERSGPRIDQIRRNRQSFRIAALQALWVPAAFEARSVLEADEALSWDGDSSTLIVEDSSTSDGLRYTVVSEAPAFEPEVLRASSSSEDPAVISNRYEVLPTDFPDEARNAARLVTDDAGGRYDKAIALQNWFREYFEYSLDVEPGHGDDALVDFLERRSGYCEQFAGAYAAMARHLGIPSRVAVGFTPGDTDPQEPGRYVVRGRHAHAWPELWFEGVGWVPFEPTPGRGIPDAENYTGVPAQQDDAVPEVRPQESTTTVPAGATPTAPSTTPSDTVARNAPLVTGGTGESGRSGLTTAAVTVGALAAAWLAAVLLTPILRRKRATAPGPASSVLSSWHDALAPIRWLTGLRPRAAETHVEFARRAAPVLTERGADLSELAGLATTAAWSPGGVDAAAAERAERLARQLTEEARRREGPWLRLRRRLSWREAFDRPAPDLSPR